MTSHGDSVANLPSDFAWDMVTHCGGTGSVVLLSSLILPHPATINSLQVATVRAFNHGRVKTQFTAAIVCMKTCMGRRAG
jgi:hypothetical protein